MLDVRRMRVLREVAERGSISAAAVSLECTQPAVSQQVRALERELGVDLLERSRGGSRPTPAGRLLIEHTEAVLARLELAETTLGQLRGAITDCVAIAAFSSAAAAIVPDAVDAFARRHPHAAVTAEDCDPARSLALLKSREVDIALVYEYDLLQPSAGSAIETEVLMVDPLFVAFPGSHPAAELPSARLADLAGERWICCSSGSDSGLVFERACHAAGFAPSVGFRSDNFGVIVNLVAAGAGLAVLPGLARPAEDTRVVVRPIAPLARRLLIAVRAGSRDRPATRAMLEILHDVAAGRST
jgi:molybdate transport repressor ModE-like protein